MQAKVTEWIAKKKKNLIKQTHAGNGTTVITIQANKMKFVPIVAMYYKRLLINWVMEEGKKTYKI